MDFSLTEEHIMIRDAARDFAQTELLPGVIERDNKQEFPQELVKKMGDLGFLGIMVDPKYGGSGMDAISYVLIMEELSKIDASASVIVSVNNSLVCYGLESYATEEQKQKYLTKLSNRRIYWRILLKRARGRFRRNITSNNCRRQRRPLRN